MPICFFMDANFRRSDFVIFRGLAFLKFTIRQPVLFDGGPALLSRLRGCVLRGGIGVCILHFASCRQGSLTLKSMISRQCFGVAEPLFSIPRTCFWGGIVPMRFQASSHRFVLSMSRFLVPISFFMVASSRGSKSCFLACVVVSCQCVL